VAPTENFRRIASRNGTQIAFWASGDGSPLLLVHGAPADHTRWHALLPYLEPHATVHAMDRRGRGGSGDSADYAVEREFEDVAAVVDAIAEVSDSPVDVYGHSYGGFCAFGAATFTANIRRLVLYEGWPLVNPEVNALPPALEERLNLLLAEDNHEAALELFMREVVMLDEDELNAVQAHPSWQARVAAVHAIPREIRACSSPQAAFDPEQAANITVATLLLVGENSSDPSKADVETVATALPDASIAVLEGQQHVADVVAPELIAKHVVEFLRE
jgi:pimeloyl-ACP methyl ester carboxylesterase